MNLTISEFVDMLSEGLGAYLESQYDLIKSHHVEDLYITASMYIEAAYHTQMAMSNVESKRNA